MSVSTLKSLTRPSSQLYSQNTASTHADPEAPIRASGSAMSLACTVSTDDWVPNKEAPIVPDHMYQGCRECPVRAACLAVAVETDSIGYWAGTTYLDRVKLRRVGAVTIDRADRVRRIAELRLTIVRRRAEVQRTHPEGEGSLHQYRARGCRCEECRACNRDQRRTDRQRRKRRADLAEAS